jgi:hypothetical protein
MKESIIYFKLSLKELFRRPRLSTLSSCLKQYASWRKYNKGDRSSVSEQMPWMSFSAIDFLNREARPDMRVFEYGSGGSTLFWSSRVRSIVSVEHDKAWYENMHQKLEAVTSSTIEYMLVEAEKDPSFEKRDFRNPDDCVSDDAHYKGYNFRKYVSTIDKYPEGSFDIIIVDGRARPSCIKHSISRLKRGGLLVVDNTDRKYYLSPFSWDRSAWNTRTFAGPVPFSRDFTETTIFTKLF